MSKKNKQQDKTEQLTMEGNNIDATELSTVEDNQADATEQSTVGDNNIDTTELSTKDDNQVDVTGNVITVVGLSTSNSAPVSSATDLFKVISTGKGKKLSPKTENHVFYELAINDDDKALYLRLSGNEGGGLHSKKWITVQSILELLDKQTERDFKSTAFRDLGLGGSSNNAGFLAAVLRSDDLGLISASDKSVFLHVLSADYLKNKADLLKLVTS
jgi:hypothetical protein